METSVTTEDGIMVEAKICEVSVDVGVSSTSSVVVCIFGISGVLVETEN